MSTFLKTPVRFRRMNQILEGGGETILQLRAARQSQDGRWTQNWLRPRKDRRAVGSNRLAQDI